jgi:hypothetical protein
LAALEENYEQLNLAAFYYYYYYNIIAIQFVIPVELELEYAVNISA